MFVGQQPVRGINTASALESPMARAFSRPGRRNTAHHRPRRHILSPAIATAENQRRQSSFPGRQPPVGGRARAGKGRSPGMNAGKAVWIEGFACQENPSIPSIPDAFGPISAAHRLWIKLFHVHAPPAHAVLATPVAGSATGVSDVFFPPLRGGGGPRPASPPGGLGEGGRTPSAPLQSRPRRLVAPVLAVPRRPPGLGGLPAGIPAARSAPSPVAIDRHSSQQRRSDGGDRTGA